jgi:hypothetical protein
MPRLHEIQQTFAEGIIEGNYHALAEATHPGDSALRSLALYRRLIRNNYMQALKITYPVLSRFIGERYFRRIARGYGKKYPSISGDLFLYGRHLFEFLNKLQVSPLLGELARLEWACHEVYQAADALPLSGERLSTLASMDPSQVIFQVHAAVRLLSFPFPVHRIWLALQPAAPADAVADLPPLPEQETWIIVMRGDGQVQVTPLAKTDYLLLEAMSRGVDAASVEQIAIEFEPEFDFPRFVATVLGLRILSGFSVEKTP